MQRRIQTRGQRSLPNPQQRATPRTAPASLVRNIHIFASAVREVLEEEILREVTSVPITVPQLHVLKLITLNGLKQVQEAALFLGVSRPAGTMNIDRLVGWGLVRRVHSTRDRRTILVSATNKGRALVASYEAAKAERLERVLSQFPSGELEHLSRLAELFAIRLFGTRRAKAGACLRCAAYIQDRCPVGRVHGGCPYQKSHAAKRE